MNGVLQNILLASLNVSLDFDIQPWLQSSAYHFTGGGSYLFQQSAAQVIKYRFADGTSYTSTSVAQQAPYAMFTIASSARQTLSVDIPNAALVTVLNLTSGQVYSIPEEVRRLINVTTLILSNNLLTTLPVLLFQLPNLQLISLNEPNISSIPAIISQQTSLRYLDIVACPSLTSLPASLSGGTLTKMHFSGLPSSFSIPNFANYTTLRELRFGYSTLQAAVNASPTTYGNNTWSSLATSLFPDGKLTTNVTSAVQLTSLYIQAPNYLRSLDRIQNLTNLTTLLIITNSYTPSSANAYDAVLPVPAIPTAFASLVNLKNIRFSGMNLNQQSVVNSVIDGLYDIVIANASMTAGGNSNIWRNVTFVFNLLTVAASGTYQQPSGYVQGSSNGTPASQREKAWILANQYGWTVSLT
ncbi:hypothetical protein QNI16_07205 [Cytophagaceae bacterium YF14B1]|uniref:Uncharacterized protein n=1 Tax=Xanthocytophaga flava TaxID=3048013 RepID=A0AAE3QNN3_9BACT|nr:hypothetical protein [Xanthocytophaga flavus]MDJ1480266.1 hypothetical protein [Xanthocytophaga flavus]